MTHELGAGYRHYHAADMFVVLTGPTIDPRHLKMHEACVDALQAVQDVLRPGNTVGDVYEAHRAAFARHGYEHALGGPAATRWERRSRRPGWSSPRYSKVTRSFSNPT